MTVIVTTAAILQDEAGPSDSPWGNAIAEFNKLGDSELDLMINNRVIGQGSAVKVGENFGLRVQSIGRVGDRIRSMGG